MKAPILQTGRIGRFHPDSGLLVCPLKPCTAIIMINKEEGFGLISHCFNQEQIEKLTKKMLKSIGLSNPITLLYGGKYIWGNETNGLDSYRILKENGITPAHYILTLDNEKFDGIVVRIKAGRFWVTSNEITNYTTFIDLVNIFASNLRFPDSIPRVLPKEFIGSNQARGR